MTKPHNLSAISKRSNRPSGMRAKLAQLGLQGLTAATQLNFYARIDKVEQHA
jgi:hypothetical protein